MPGVAPALAGAGRSPPAGRAEVEDVDDQQVAGLGALDAIGPLSMCATGQVDVADVVGGVVVADLAVGPLPALDPELVAGRTVVRRRDVRVPAVVAGHRLVAHRLPLASKIPARAGWGAPDGTGASSSRLNGTRYPRRVRAVRSLSRSYGSASRLSRSPSIAA
jgi:hypothetical protein